jgi:hypothetical protein
MEAKFYRVLGRHKDILEILNDRYEHIRVNPSEHTILKECERFLLCPHVSDSIGSSYAYNNIPPQLYNMINVRGEALIFIFILWAIPSAVILYNYIK